ncbi:class I SAM-dependent methyltransferase [Castellaniella hirudinis]|uniref:Class I SAM-dependent methyltransferase n=1 Tax=Castellaniella hirudinis TaxID=1144617 RepID=A0ABV8RWW6_9BURK
MKSCLECKSSFTSPGWACPVCGYEPVRLDGFVAHAPALAHEGGGFKAEYFQELAALEESNFWFRARNALILWALRTFKPESTSFLEVGCGTGFVLSGIACNNPGITVSGSEIFLSGLPYAASRVSSAEFMQMDARHIPFVEEFDAIGSFDVLEHIEQDELVLNQMSRALKPGGLLLLTVPQHSWLWSAADEYACHVRRYGREEMQEKVRRAGFSILRTTSFVSLLLPAMLLSRKKKSQSIESPEYDPAQELRISGVLNACLLAIMRFESVLIRLGLNFPIGGSRLVVAKKLS